MTTRSWYPDVVDDGHWHSGAGWRVVALALCAMIVLAIGVARENPAISMAGTALLIGTLLLLIWEVVRSGSSTP